MDARELLDALILNLVKESGSDIHFVSGSSPAIRLNGKLNIISKIRPLSQSDTLSIIREMINDEQYNILIREQQIDFAYKHRNEYRLRGNAFFQQGSISIVLRLVPKVKPLSDLNLPESLYDFTKVKQGFFLVTGPVGQGKSTTLAAMLQYINQNQNKIIVTIEDPVEFIYDSDKSIFTQREIGVDAPDFASALRGAFRQDVDVILIGEMRDPETIKTAITAAETGHLVFATMHTNSAAQTIDRILDSFSGNEQDQIRAQLSTALTGVLSQRLVTKSGGGMVPAIELMMANNAVQNLIREKRVYEIDNVIETGSSNGMISIDKTLANLTINGVITMEEAYRVSKNQKMLEQYINFNR